MYFSLVCPSFCVHFSFSIQEIRYLSKKSAFFVGKIIELRDVVLKFILFETSCSFCRFIRFIAIQNARSGQALGRFVLILRRPPPCALVSSPAARFLNCRKMYEPRTIHKKSRKKRTLQHVRI